MDVTIYHNPRCSKSRQTLELLKNKGVEPRVIEYLKTPPDEQELAEILQLLGLGPRDLVRTGGPEYKANNLDDTSLSDDQLIGAIVKFPVLMQRPIVIANGKAAVGRPPENVLAIL